MAYTVSFVKWYEQQTIKMLQDSYDRRSGWDASRYLQLLLICGPQQPRAEPHWLQDFGSYTAAWVSYHSCL